MELLNMGTAPPGASNGASTATAVEYGGGGWKRRQSSSDIHDPSPWPNSKGIPVYLLTAAHPDLSISCTTTSGCKGIYRLEHGEPLSMFKPVFWDVVDGWIF